MKSKSINIKNLARELNADYNARQLSIVGQDFQRASFFEIRCQTVVNLIEIFCLGKGHGVKGIPKRGESMLKYRIDWVNEKIKD